MRCFFLLLFTFIYFFANAQINDKGDIVKKPEIIEPETSKIPMNIPIPKSINIPQLKQPVILPPPGYMGYDMDKLLHFTPENPYDPTKLHLNMNFEAPKSIRELLRDDPANALLMGGAIVLGLLNNHIQGEDKMNKIRVEQGVQSRSGVPESARSGQGYITIKDR